MTTETEYDLVEHYKTLAERFKHESDAYQAKLYDSFRVIQGQGKGLKRQARKIKRMRAQMEADYQTLLKLTMELDEHPEDYDGPCLCKLCASYG